MRPCLRKQQQYQLNSWGSRVVMGRNGFPTDNMFFLVALGLNIRLCWQIKQREGKVGEICFCPFASTLGSLLVFLSSSCLLELLHRNRIYYSKVLIGNREKLLACESLRAEFQDFVTQKYLRSFSVIMHRTYYFLLLEEIRNLRYWGKQSESLL